MLQKTEIEKIERSLKYYRKVRGKEFNKKGISYIYFIKNKKTKIKYIGLRYANNESPKNDLGKVYFSSGPFKKRFKNNTSNYEFYPVWTFRNPIDAILFEFKTIKTITRIKRFFKGTEFGKWANRGAFPHFEFDKETKDKISEALKKYYAINPDARKKLSERTKEVMARPEVQKKMKIALKKAFSKPEVRKKMSESAKKYYATNPDARKKNSEALKKYFLNPDARKKTSETTKKGMNNKATRKKLSRSLKKYFQDSKARKRASIIAKKAAAKPDVQKKLSLRHLGRKQSKREIAKRTLALRKVFSTPEYKKKCALRQKRRWKDKDYRKKMSKSLKITFKRKGEKKLKSFVQSFLPNTKGGKYENSNAYNNSAT